MSLRCSLVVALLVAGPAPASAGLASVPAPDGRIETGRHVQGILANAQVNRILQDIVAPHFQGRHVDLGLRTELGAIATLLHPGSKQVAVPEEAAPPPGMAIPPELIDPRINPLSNPLSNAAAEPVHAPAATREEPDDASDGFPYGKMLLLLLVCLVWSAAFTKRGRGRLQRGELPEAVLYLPVYILFLCIVDGVNERINGGSSGGSTGNADSGRRRGTFDGGGASGNW